MTKPPKSLVRRTPWPASSSRAVVTPMQPSVVYASESPDALDDQYEGRAKGYTYAREGHPNADVLAAKIDMLEGATGGLILGSGHGGDHGGDAGAAEDRRSCAGGQPALWSVDADDETRNCRVSGSTTSLADPTDVAAMRGGSDAQHAADPARGGVEPDAAGVGRDGHRGAGETARASCW